MTSLEVLGALFGRAKAVKEEARRMAAICLGFTTSCQKTWPIGWWKQAVVARKLLVV